MSEGADRRANTQSSADVRVTPSLSPEARAQEIRARVEQATKGPWLTTPDDSSPWDALHYAVLTEDVPWLLDQLASLRAQLADATRDAHRCSGCGHRWYGPLRGADLCGDCWRRGQTAILGPPPGAGEPDVRELIERFKAMRANSEAEIRRMKRKHLSQVSVPDMYVRHGEACTLNVVIAELEALLASRAPAPRGFVDGVLYCYGGCGRRYTDFPLDVILPNAEWNRIAVGEPYAEPRPSDEQEGRGGVLCAMCIVERLSQLPDVTVAFLTTDERCDPNKAVSRAPASEEPRRALVVASKDGSSEWWVCFRCWVAYHVPTTGYYAKCHQCGYDTRPWPANPLDTLRLTEWRRPNAASEASLPPAEAQGPATGWQPSEAIGPLNGVRQAIDEAWLDIAEWQRLAREQRAAHPNPNHAPKMPSEAGIQKSERVRQNLALADVALVTLAKLLAPSGGSAPPPVCTRGKSSSAIGTARRATTIARRQRSR
jgi:hypothetical protein